MFVYELIGLFLRSLNSTFFILEKSVAFFPKLPQTTSFQPYPLRKEQIYVTRRLILRRKFPQNVKGKNIDPKKFSRGEIHGTCHLAAGAGDDIKTIKHKTINLKC